MMTYEAKMDEIRGFLKNAEPEPKRYGGFVEMKDELLMDAPKQEGPTTVTYGDSVLILAKSDRETVEVAERVLEARMERVACGIGAPESMKTFRTSVSAGDIVLDGYTDPLFACKSTVYINSRMDVPIEKHSDWVMRKKREEDENGN